MKRYSIKYNAENDFQGEMEYDDQGKWVLYEDIKHLTQNYSCDNCCQKDICNIFDVVQDFDYNTRFYCKDWQKEYTI